MEICEKCGRATAEFDMHYGVMVCYNPKCGQEVKVDDEAFWCVAAPFFTVGIRVKRGVVVDVPPIVKYMKGWSESDMLKYINKKGWFYTLA